MTTGPAGPENWHATADRVVDVAAPGGAGCCKPNTARIALDKWALELSKTSSCPLTPTQRVQVAKRKRKEEEEDEKILLGPRQDEVTRVQLERATKEVVCESKCPQLWPTPPEVPITTIPTSTRSDPLDSSRHCPTGSSPRGANRAVFTSAARGCYVNYSVRSSVPIFWPGWPGGHSALKAAQNSPAKSNYSVRSSVKIGGFGGESRCEAAAAASKNFAAKCSGASVSLPSSGSAAITTEGFLGYINTEPRYSLSTSPAWVFHLSLQKIRFASPA